MSKAAIKKREQRKKWSDEKRKAVNAKKAEKQREDYAKLEDEKKAPKKEANKLRMREVRGAEKLAKSLSSNDENDTEEMSEYEKLRLNNIQERNEKFKKQFGIPDPNLFDSKHANSKLCKWTYNNFLPQKQIFKKNMQKICRQNRKIIDIRIFLAGKNFKIVLML